MKKSKVDSDSMDAETHFMLSMASQLKKVSHLMYRPLLIFIVLPILFWPNLY